MRPPRPNTPSRHRSSQAIKAGPEPEADTEAQTSAPGAKIPHRRRHNHVAETEPEAEIETSASRALTSWHNRRRPSQPTEADSDVEEAENQFENLTQATIPTTNPPAPRQWALYFANLVRLPFIPSPSCFFSRRGHCLLPTLLPIHSHHNNTLTHLI